MGEKNKGKRIAADDFWKIRDLGKVLDKKRSKYQKWLRKKARSESCYIDQITEVLSGRIQMDPTKEHPNGEIRRMSNVFLEAAEKQFDELNVVATEYNDMCEKVAREYSVSPDRLDAKTGIIRPDDRELAEKVKVESIIKPIDMSRKSKKKEAKKKG